MTYAYDNLIEASDYNTVFRNPIQLLYGTGYADRGYGQSAIVIPTVTAPILDEPQELVKATEWATMRSVMVVLANHQGTAVTLPPSGDLVTDQLVKYYVGNTTALASLDTQRLSFANDAMTTFANRTSPSDTRSTSWTTQIVHEFTMNFTTVDKARYFFNSGGSIKFTPSRTGGSATTHNQFWTDLCNFYGSVSMGAHGNRSIYHYNSGVTGVPGRGYYELPMWSGSWTPGDILWKGVGDGSTYSFATYAGSGNNITIYGVTMDGMTGGNGDNGKTLRFRVEFNDVIVEVPDTISGTIKAAISIQKATTYLTTETPTFSNITSLSSGS